jgi:hypothetical protein
VLSANGISLANYYFDSEYAREDARSAARFLESAAKPRDIILFNGSPTAFQHYYKGNLPIVRVAAYPLKNTLLVQDKLPQITKTHDRIWLVEFRPWETDPNGKVKATLDNLAQRDAEKRFPGVQIHSYQVTDRRS